MVKSYRPESLKEALSVMAEQPCIPYAGGTDLMVRHKPPKGLCPSFNRPLMFIGHLSELNGIEKWEESLVIGAAISLSKLLSHDLCPEILRKSIEQLSSVGIRNSGTLGGNICNASPAGDTLPPLYALEALCVIQSSTETIEIPIIDFITGPGQTILKKNQLLTHIKIPFQHFNRTYYRKVGTRKANALSKVSFAGLADIHDNTIKDIRISLGAVAPVVIKSQEIENMIKYIPEKQLPSMVEEIIQRYYQLIKPINDQRSSAEYRKTVALGLIENFLKLEEI